MRIIKIVLLAVLALAPFEALAEPEPSALGFAKMFSDNMVVQQAKPIKVWGTAPAKTKLTVQFANQTQKVKAGSDGRWTATFKPLAAGGPFELHLSDGSDELRLRNILVGDVWLCSGQSNMAWQVSNSTPPLPWAGQAPDNVRLLTVERDFTAAPLTEFRKAPHWQMANEASLNDFSGVCAYFAEKLAATLNVPLGLINSAWGGSQLEAWMSADALAQVPGFSQDLALLKNYIQSPEAAQHQYAEQWQAWWQAHTKPWVKPTEQVWKPVPAMQNWKEFGDQNLLAHDGMVWFVTEFELTEEQAKQSARLSLGGIDEVDLTWVNGEFIGTEFGWGTPRTYPVKHEVLQPGRNLLVVNVLSTWGSGGMLGPEQDIALELDNGERVTLVGHWRYSKVPTTYGLPKSAPWQSINGLSSLYNAMIAPLTPANIKGVLWYQGESNTGRAKEYERLLKGLIGDWRQQFGKYLPFLVVQLPNFGSTSATAVESGWAELRQAQWQAVKDDPLAGLVVTVDLGEAADLHPKNKRPVGERAALVALAIENQGTDPIHGIEPVTAQAKGEQFVVSFAKGLNLSNKGKLTNFELCADTCTRVNAALKSNQVWIAKAQLPGATRVRYCWDEAPECHLVAENGWPVSSFELPINP